MKFTFSLLFILSALSIFAQRPDLAHYISIPTEINPAYVGSYNQFRTTTRYISQWHQYENQPEELSVNMEAPLSKINSTLGLLLQNHQHGTMFNDRRTQLSYAYTIDFNKIILQFGTGLQYGHKRGEGELFGTIGEPEYFSFEYHVFNITNGVFLYNDNFYASIAYSEKDIFNNLDYDTYDKRGIYIYSGYHFFKGKTISFCPSVSITPYPDETVLGMNLSSTISKVFWISASLDTWERLKLLAGIEVKHFHLGARFTKDFTSIDPYSKFRYGYTEVFGGFYF